LEEEERENKQLENEYIAANEMDEEEEQMREGVDYV
jgi:hypothetical protein